MVYMRPVDNADAVKVVQGTGFRDPTEYGSTSLGSVAGIPRVVIPAT